MEHTVYLYSAIVGCTFVGLQVIMQVFGMLDGVDAADAVDADGDHVDTSGAFFGILSFKALCAFAGIFGLAGLMMTRGDAAMHARILVAFGSGVAAMFGVAWMMNMLSRLQSSGTLELANAVGRSAVVYLRIPGNNAGAGKVTLDVQGRSIEMPAVTDGDDIPTGARVTVVAVVGDETLKVTPLK